MRRRTAVLTASALAGAAVVARRRAAAAAAVPAPERPAPLEGRTRTVRTDDGVELHVAEHGPADTPVVMVLAHGYTQASRLWDGTVRALLALRDDLRVVVYDHRGHGRSGRATQETATLEQLGRDLARVVDEVAGDRPVVLGGHSMGGMTLMALAEQRPELFGDRVVGAAFVGTSSGGLADVTWSLPAPVARAVKKLLPLANERAYRAELAGKGRTQVAALDRFVLFAAGASPADVQDVLAVQAECSAETIHLFLDTFTTHDRVRALEALREVPALVVAGDQDRLCPVEHSRTIADALPLGELVVYPGVGHMVHVERRLEVARHLSALVDRALAGRRPALRSVG
ncbi:MAG TPA: alpha/beta hydrolase [Mycobacteriales bacterium]|nr:alpha/beta hydrolase [Mycobacteriales bacterium]